MGGAGIIRERPGVEPDFITRDNASDARQDHALPSVPMPVKRNVKTTRDECEACLAPGDTMNVPAGLDHSAASAMTGVAAMFHVVGTGDGEGATWKE